MNFTCTVDIQVPRSKVVALFEAVEHLKEWQDGFQSLTHLSGEKGKEGAKSKMVYHQKKRVIELEETILVSNFPEEFTGEYVHIHMTNTMQNIFTELDENTTRWTANIEYTKLNGFVVKVLAKLFPSMFRKQTQKWMDQFKAFAEREIAL